MNYGYPQYLPQWVVQGGAFPQPYGKDLIHQVNMIEEMFRRYKSEIEYHPIDKAITPVTSLTTQLSGEPGTTQFDPLWGESIDIPSGQPWVQPHVTEGVNAAQPEKYRPTVKLFADVVEEFNEQGLKQFNEDEPVDLKLVIPLSLLDRAGVFVQNGDRLDWSVDRYEVLSCRPTTRWQNSNVYLYMGLALRTIRRGA